MGSGRELSMSGLAICRPWGPAKGAAKKRPYATITRKSSSSHPSHENTGQPLALRSVFFATLLWTRVLTTIAGTAVASRFNSQ